MHNKLYYNYFVELRRTCYNFYFLFLVGKRQIHHVKSSFSSTSSSTHGNFIVWILNIVPALLRNSIKLKVNVEVSINQIRKPFFSGLSSGPVAYADDLTLCQHNPHQALFANFKDHINIFNIIYWLKFFFLHNISFVLYNSAFIKNFYLTFIIYKVVLRIC